MLRFKLFREALEGMFGFFQVASTPWCIWTDSSTFYSCQNLLSCTTILVHHVLPYVGVPQGSPVRDYWDLLQWVPSRVCVSSRFAIRDGTTGKYMRYEWGLFQWALTSRQSLKYDVVHAMTLRMDVVSIVNGNECERFRECWHERFWMCCDFLEVR
jgi:hypothetical protein